MSATPVHEPIPLALKVSQAGYHRPFSLRWALATNHRVSEDSGPILLDLRHARSSSERVLGCDISAAQRFNHHLLCVCQLFLCRRDCLLSCR